MSDLKLTSFEEDKKSTILIYEGTNVHELSTKANSIFLAEKYKLEKGTAEDGVYGIGNTTMRILFGAFIKRYTFQIRITDLNGKTRIELHKAMTGISGGAIGYAKMIKEFKRISEKIKQIS